MQQLMKQTLRALVVVMVMMTMEVEAMQMLMVPQSAPMLKLMLLWQC
jgi:hypothetical protein